MPLFGARMVCETANYKYIQKRDKKFAKRENILGRWVKEKRERRARLTDLKERIQKANDCKTQSPDGGLTPTDILQRSESVRSLREALSNPSSPRLEQPPPCFPTSVQMPPQETQDSRQQKKSEDPVIPEATQQGLSRSKLQSASFRKSLRRDSKHGSIGFTHDINGHKLHKRSSGKGGKAEMTLQCNDGSDNCVTSNKSKLKKGVLSMVAASGNKYARLEEESVISQDSRSFGLDDPRAFRLAEEKTTSCSSCNIL